MYCGYKIITNKLSDFFCYEFTFFPSCRKSPIELLPYVCRFSAPGSSRSNSWGCVGRYRIWSLWFNFACTLFILNNNFSFTDNLNFNFLNLNFKWKYCNTNSYYYLKFINLQTFFKQPKSSKNNFFIYFLKIYSLK